MEQSRVNRFRANPIEVTIFSIISLVFANSLYNLFYDREIFQARSLKAMASSPLHESKRRPSSLSSSELSDVNLKCDPSLTKLTGASKIRLKGGFCGDPTPS